MHCLKLFLDCVHQHQWRTYVISSLSRNMNEMNKMHTALSCSICSLLWFLMYFPVQFSLFLLSCSLFAFTSNPAISTYFTCPFALNICFLLSLTAWAHLTCAHVSYHKENQPKESFISLWCSFNQQKGMIMFDYIHSLLLSKMMNCLQGV